MFFIFTKKRKTLVNSISFFFCIKTDKTYKMTKRTADDISWFDNNGIVCSTPAATDATAAKKKPRVAAKKHTLAEHRDWWDGCEKYITPIEGVNETLEKYGVAVIPNVLSPQECAATYEGMWKFLEHVSQKWPAPICRNKPETHWGIDNLFILHGGLLKGNRVGHTQTAWDVRQNVKVAGTFAALWKVDMTDLLTSFDGAFYGIQPENATTSARKGWYAGNDWFHCDQSYSDSKKKCIQGWVTALDIEVGDATLSFLEGSHLYHREFSETFRATQPNGVFSTDNWYVMQEEHLKFYADRGCVRRCIACPAGSMVLWDSRTIHMGQPALKGRENPKERCIHYVCMTPRAWATQKELEKKQQIFTALRMTSHWPAGNHVNALTQRTYGKVLPEMTLPEAPILNDLGKRLAGF